MMITEVKKALIGKTIEACELRGGELELTTMSHDVVRIGVQMVYGPDGLGEDQWLPRLAFFFGEKKETT